MLARLAGAAGRPAGTPGGLVLVPTRELAGQVQDALAPLGQPMGVRVLAVYGGASMGRQIAALRRGVDLLVATPGRLLDLIRQGECSLGSVEVTAIDEADHMADLGFLPDVTQILDMTRTGGQRLLFSATLDRGVDRLARAYLSDPVAIAVASAASPVESMDHLAFTVRHEDKVAVLSQIAGRPARTLIFVRTKHGADRLARQLSRRGHRGRRHPRQPGAERPAAGTGRLRGRSDPGARGHRRRGARHPRRRRGPGRALRPAGRPQGLPAPLRPHGAGRRDRYGAVDAAAGAGPRRRPAVAARGSRRADHSGGAGPRRSARARPVRRADRGPRRGAGAAAARIRLWP